jgi:hypothetical protein
MEIIHFTKLNFQSYCAANIKHLLSENLRLRCLNGDTFDHRSQ